MNTIQTTIQSIFSFPPSQSARGARPLPQNTSHTLTTDTFRGKALFGSEAVNTNTHTLGRLDTFV